MSSEAKAVDDRKSSLTIRHKLGYGAGDAGGVVTFEFLQAYLNRYVTNVLGVSFATVSILLLIWNIWDMVNDPLMGNIMDRVFVRSGGQKDKFRPWIRASVPVIVIGLIAFFTVPGYFNGWMQVAALFLLKIVYEFGYTMMNIAMGSLLSAMALNDTERSILSSARGLGSVVGGFTMMFVVPQILSRLGENRQGYSVASVFCAVAGGLLIFIHFAWTEERNKSAQQETEKKDKIEFTDIFVALRRNRPYLALCLHSIVIVFAQLLHNQTATYIYADHYSNIGIMSARSVISTVLSILFLIATPFVVKIVGSTINVIRGCQLIAVAMYVVLYLAMMAFNVNVNIYLVVSSLATAFMTVSILQQWGLVAQSIDYNDKVTGKRNEGTLYGFFSLTRRLGNTIAQSLVVLAIGWIGYNQAAANAGQMQSAGTIQGLFALNLLGPAIGTLLSFLSFTFVWKIAHSAEDNAL